MERWFALQLGHGFFSVETLDVIAYLFRLTKASIGPRIFLRGNKYLRWKADLTGIELQLGHGFFSVETPIAQCRAAQTHSASIGPRIFLRGNRATRPGADIDLLRFNWATDFSPWKRVFICVLLFNIRKLQLGHGFFSVETSLQRHIPRLGPGASIGPRIFLRGNASVVIRPFATAASFNWATDFSPWKRAIPLGIQPDALPRLQLGHGFFSVETTLP